MAKAEDGIATKERMADALLYLLNSGTPLRKIRIRQITERCGVDRQTFYFHFRDIYDLGAYAYNREIARLFGYSDVENTFLDYADNHVPVILSALKQSSSGLRDLLFFMYQQNPHGNFYQLVRRNIQLSFDDLAHDGKHSPQKLEMATEMATTASVAIILSWLKGEFDLPVEKLSALLNDAVAALRPMAEKQCRNGSML